MTGSGFRDRLRRRYECTSPKGRNSLFERKHIMPPWNALATIVPVAQEYQNFCAAASIQMILEGIGLTGLGPGAQYLFNQSINIFKSPLAIGNPLGVACTINRFNSGESGDPLHPSPPSKEYRTLRSETPYDACALIVNSIKEFGSAAAVQVLGGNHWVVLYGANGDGDPMGGRYTVDTLLLCNPDNGFFGDSPKPGKLGFTLETYTYASFILTYFTGTYFPTVICQELCDGRKFIIVADRRAVAKGDLAMPIPELLSGTPPVPAVPTADSIEKLSRKASHDWIRTAEPRRSLLVKRLDRPDDYYYLHPYALKERGVNIVRLDRSGNYLGMCSAPTADPAIFDDDMRLGLERAAEHLNAEFGGPRFAQDMLVWHPSVESTSPYRPFRVIRDGESRVFVSLEGEVTRQLHSLETNAVLDLSAL